jgi:hypothetical protein
MYAELDAGSLAAANYPAAPTPSDEAASASEAGADVVAAGAEAEVAPKLPAARRQPAGVVVLDLDDD